MKKKSLLLIVFSLLLLVRLSAGEGMWLPLLLKALNEKEMKSLGMKISADDIYNINRGSLKDAIVHFGGGCTSEIISAQGLLLTNHHCGYGYIQSHSSIERNLLRDGFWARGHSEELRCEGLTATLIVRMEDVTAQVLEGVGPTWKENDRRNKIDENIQKLKPRIARLEDQDVFIRGFYNNNQYFAFVTEVFRDVRLVGTPPEAIGKFGADTDNWVWPRHTGDFSLFRIYAGKNNRPAPYDPDNQPYVPKHFLPISLKGVREGDFTMVFGFPGRTNQYLTREGARQMVEVLNPVRIAQRDRALKIMDREMRADAGVKIQYAPKYAGIANAWKKWIGENLGMRITGGLDRKAEQDSLFQARVSADPRFAPHANLVADLDDRYRRLEPFAHAREYYLETFHRNLDLVDFYQMVSGLINTYEGRGEDAFDKRRKEIRDLAAAYYRDVNMDIDKEIFVSLGKQFYASVNPAFVYSHFRELLGRHGGDIDRMATELYSSSALTRPEALAALMDKPYAEWIRAVREDPVWKFYEEMKFYLDSDLNRMCSGFEDEIAELRRSHMAALMEVFPERRFYPDANSTLRVTYGKVQGYYPKDGVHYLNQTYLDGVMEKYVPGDYEFDVPKKLQQLYREKDYGPYGVNGKMPLAFIGSNHTTGGNSGSPAIDAHGNLVGLNFDRVWEGTMSDINYDRSICRNIMVDARYILFIIDKFAGASWLVDEMKLVGPTKKSRRKK